MSRLFGPGTGSIIVVDSRATAGETLLGDPHRPARTKDAMLLTIKFGGTSVGDAERIRSAATLVQRLLREGHRVVVVTSAMAGVTNRLVDLAREATAPENGDGNRVADYF